MQHSVFRPADKPENGSPPKSCRGLQQEAIQAQSANVNIVTGATLTSEGFRQSLATALNQAQG